MGNNNSNKSTSSVSTQRPFKPLFSHSIKWRCANPADFAYINKLRPKLLSRINFSNIETQILSGKAVRSLRRVLADAKRSSRFSIENSRLNPKQLHEILNSTNHLKKIKICPTGSELDNSTLSDSLTRIGRNKNLSELTVSCLKEYKEKQEDETYHIRKQLNQLKQLRKLESLDLDLPFCNSEIILSLQPLRSLKSFGISIDQNSLLKQSRLPHLLSQCNRLSELTLNFDHFDGIDFPTTQLWTSFFQKVQSLKSLNLIRSFSATQDFDGFQVFPECFKDMEHLIALKVELDISWQKLVHDPETFIALFFDSLKSLHQLQKLEFTIVDDYILKDIHIKHLVSALGCLKNLHTLELNIPCLESSDELVILLAKTLQNLSCLKHFKLKFGDARNPLLSYKAMETFAKSLTRLQLKSLDLALSNQCIALSDQSLQLNDIGHNHKVPLLSAISSLKDLSSLYLDLSPFFPQLCKDFCLSLKNPRQLTSLSVVVGQCSSADNYERLSKLMLCLKVMPNLTTLKLKLSGGMVCDQEIDLFLRNLEGCPNLHRLELTIKKTGHLTGKFLDSLQAALVKLTKLEYLEMNLWNSQRFGDHINANKFLDGLFVLKRLKELIAKFGVSHPYFPNPAWKESMQKFKNLKYLTRVEIDSVRYL